MPTLNWIGKEAVVKHHKFGAVQTCHFVCCARCQTFPSATPGAGTSSFKAATCTRSMHCCPDTLER